MAGKDDLSPPLPDLSVLLGKVDERLLSQLRFILEIDKLKSVKRMTPLLDQTRTETDAEHSWHVALMAAILAEHADPRVDVSRVTLMMLIHDIVEIDAGDTFLYDDQGHDGKDSREQAAADRLFGLLPADMGETFKQLWKEFEARETPDAKFAATLDRLQPLLHNFFTGGGTWKQPAVTAAKVRDRKSIIAQGSDSLWAAAQQLIAEGVRRGYLRTEEDKAARASQAEKEEDIFATDRLRRFDAFQLPTPVKKIAETYGQRFGSTFKTFVHFPFAMLDDLHRGEDGQPASGCTVVSQSDGSILDELAQISSVANEPTPSEDQRRAYMAAFVSIFQRLPADAIALIEAPDTIVIAPQREGHLLAELLNWLPEGRHLVPHAKRMPTEGGLLVGVDDLSLPPGTRRCVIIDGAIASGVTIMAIVDRLADTIPEFEVLSVHCANSSLGALSRFARERGVAMRIAVGHASGDLNNKFYAVDENDPNRLVLGDVGDMISPVVATAGQVPLAAD